MVKKGGRIVKISVKGYDDEEKLSFPEEKKGLIKTRKQLFETLVQSERERTLMILMSLHEMNKLTFEDMEEVYNDGCLELWKKMMDEEFELMERGMVSYLRKICWNVGMHYVRDKKNYMESLDVLMEKNDESVGEEDSGLAAVFDVFEEEMNDEERMSRFDRVWAELKPLDKMILTSYYVEDCKLEEVAKKVGYKNGNTVKSRKDKVLKKMLTKMKKMKEAKG